MSKIITSPVKKYPGTVTLADPLTFPQAFAFEDALERVRELRETNDLSRLRYALLEGVIPSVEEWHLENFPEQVSLETFPSTPRLPIVRLIDWLVEEVSTLYEVSEDVPLA